MANWIVLDTSSGTWFSASRAVLLNYETLTEDEQETLEEGSDNERNELGDIKGKSLADWYSR
jgi:hypothetical protein